MPPLRILFYEYKGGIMSRQTLMQEGRSPGSVRTKAMIQLILEPTKTKTRKLMKTPGFS